MASWAPRVRAGFRAAHAVRARVAEDVAIDGLAAGRRDYVILGAGGHTFAWRHVCAAQFVVWEVDTAATQKWKRDVELSGCHDVPGAAYESGDPAGDRIVGCRYDPRCELLARARRDG